MAGELQIYISAAQEMDPESDLISKLLAEHIKTIRWRIWRTPLHGMLNPDRDIITSSPFFVILLGTDLVAPMGVEWDIAARAGSFVIAFRDESRTISPAADYFIRNMEISWQTFKRREAFILAFERILLTQLLNGPPGYGLDLHDIELIADRLRLVESAAPAPEVSRREAGQGGVILTSPSGS
ncbi:MAG: hypothetical protein ACYC6L_10800 [Anaerolineae bacterium]